jgi:hypothetical protein
MLFNCSSELVVLLVLVDFWVQEVLALVLGTISNLVLSILSALASVLFLVMKLSNYSSCVDYNRSGYLCLFEE